MRLSILDQSPIAQGSDAHTALAQTAKIAELAERLGYTRFWVSEHHDASSLAGSTPEVLLAHLGARTSAIRLGSGGVMLPHYSAYKVAENFRMLEALYPGRIDVGLGRAPGGLPIATRALQEGRAREISYSQQVDDLRAYLTDTLPDDHRFAGIHATPRVQTAPEIWLLGSSDVSARMAAAKGTAFMFARFINGEGGVDAVQAYRDSFVPSATLQAPVSSVAVFVICADTDAEAERIASSLDLALVLLASGKRADGTPLINDALAYPYTMYEEALRRENRKRMIVGSQATVKQQFHQLAMDYGVDEVMAVTTTAEFEHRVRSFELLAAALIEQV